MRDAGPLGDGVDSGAQGKRGFRCERSVALSTVSAARESFLGKLITKQPTRFIRSRTEPAQEGHQLGSLPLAVDVRVRVLSPPGMSRPGLLFVRRALAADHSASAASMASSRKSQYMSM